MDYSIGFRSFEERDVDFIYQCKNDERLNNMIVGQYKKYSREDAEQWVRGVIRADRNDMKFWVLCTNDSERRIIGWESLSEIDFDNSSACHHGLVIGDPDYRDGVAMFEAMLFAMDYVFNTLNLHRLYGCCLSEHNTTTHLLSALGFVKEGVRRDAYYKNGRYYDLFDYGLLKSEYNQYDENGRFMIKNLFKCFVNSLRDSKNE